MAPAKRSTLREKSARIANRSCKAKASAQQQQQWASLPSVGSVGSTSDNAPTFLEGEEQHRLFNSRIHVSLGGEGVGLEAPLGPVWDIHEEVMRDEEEHEHQQEAHATEAACWPSPWQHNPEALVRLGADQRRHAEAFVRLGADQQDSQDYEAPSGPVWDTLQKVLGGMEEPQQDGEGHHAETAWLFPWQEHAQALLSLGADASRVKAVIDDLERKHWCAMLVVAYFSTIYPPAHTPLMHNT